MTVATPPAAFDWRPARPADIFVLAALYRDAVLRLGSQSYTPEQARAWASFADDTGAFGGHVLQADTWIAERPGDGRVLGFCGIDREGESRELQSLFVSTMLARRGLGREMLRRTLQRAELHGARRFAAWSTPLSRPVFEAVGFVLTRTERAPFAGMTFERHRVERG